MPIQFFSKFSRDGSSEQLGQFETERLSSDLWERRDVRFSERLERRSSEDQENESYQSDIGDRSDALVAETLQYKLLRALQGQQTETQYGVRDAYNQVSPTTGTSEGNDVVFGGVSDDLIRGEEGDDMLNGGAGDDQIYGGAGRDILEGGTGNDALTGGEGIDVFIFREGSGTTTITDFEAGYDILDLEGFGGVSYDELISTGTQVGDDVHFDAGNNDLLIMEGFELATMIADDLCIR